MMKTHSDIFKKEGFTVMELVVVIVIVALFTGSAGVFMHRNNQRSLLNRAAIQLLTDVRYIQEMAMNHNQDIDVSFSGGAYTAVWSGGGVVTSDFTGRDFGENFAGFGVGISGPNFTFFADGLPDANVSVTVSVGSNARTINIIRQTGFSYITS